jgi:glycosyltransferase involved in cell wall biosynthesis
MANPRFSVVIPTRERASTLYYAIRSCLAQNFDDYEIIVCDNCGSPATRETIERLASPKIRYVRSEIPLAMSDNWELAVSRARGEFVTVIGDDDGLCRHALSEADSLIRTHRTRLIRWAYAYYKWPDYAGQADANRLSFRVSGKCQRVKGSRLIEEIVAEPRRYHELPMIYNSFVHRDLIDEMRKRTGRVFHAISPDVYSGFAFAELAGKFISVIRPMGICGTSSQSTGQASVIGRGAASGIVTDFVDSCAKSGLFWNKQVPRVHKSISAVVAESYAQAIVNLHGELTWTRAQRKSLTAAIVRDLLDHPNLSKHDRLTACESIKKWCQANTALAEWFQSNLEPTLHAPATENSPPHQWCKGFGANCLDIDAFALGVRDVDGAAELIENILGCRGRPVRGLIKKPLNIRTIAQRVLPLRIYRAIALSAPVIRRKAA